MCCNEECALLCGQFLAQLAEGHESLWYGAESVRPASTFSFKRLLLKNQKVLQMLGFHRYKHLILAKFVMLE